MDERMDKWMVEYKDKCVDGSLDVEWLNEYIGGWMVGW
jgi:hypothetical protein